MATQRKRPRRGTPVVPDKARELIDADKPLFEVTFHVGAKHIHCHICGKDSYSPQDIAHKFCGFCKVFFEDVRMAYAALKIVENAQEENKE